MTGETKKRIEDYRAAIPEMKEKVIVTVFSLLIAAAVTITATYAWITISRAPEVSSIATTMASNGNLEIALSNDMGTEPNEFDVDEKSSKANDINSTNLQWGNLINLGDASFYGISNLALRPATLNEESLLNNPLKGAAYGSDGRVTELDSRYTFAKWSKNDKLFKADKTYGVRAIASYTMKETETSNAEFEKKYNEVMTAFSAVSAYYQSEDGFMGTVSGLGTVMSTYLQAKLNDRGVGTGQTLYLDKPGLQDILDAYQALFHTMELHMEALVKLANLQQYMFANPKEMSYDAITAQDLLNNPGKYDSSRDEAGNPKEPIESIMLNGLIKRVTKQNSNGAQYTVDQGFIADYKQAQADIAKIKQLISASETRSIEAKEIDAIVSNLSAPSDAKIDDRPVSEWMEMVKDKESILANAMTILTLQEGDHTVQLCDGILKRLEQYAVNDTARLKKSKKDFQNAARIVAHAKAAGITADIDMTGHIYTDATGLKTSSSDASVDISSFQGGERVAQDTYGMAMDFWVRTNAEETYLTLEGALATDQRTGEILRYDGVNRVWGSTGNTNLTTDSTTQGGGSCYIYYADTPDDVARSLDLLTQMKVAFVDESGTLLAQASMATQEGQYYAQNGRITVPLVIEAGSGIGLTYTYTNDKQEEEEAAAIQELTMDNPQRITAIIYLDGKGLDNTMVLSSAEIQGQLNIQFGSSVNLNTSGDKALETAVRKVTASLTPSSFDYAANRENMVTHVSVTVDGATPTQVKAFFVRALNSTQGSREGTFEFEKKYTTEDTTITEWTGSYKFTAPGTYYLRYIQLDGVDYALSEPLKVTISGIDVKSVIWDHSENEHTVYSNESSYKQWLQVEIGAGDGVEPEKVTAVFRRTVDNIPVRVATTKNVEGNWVGTAGFSASGEYVLSEIEVDGFPYQVSASHQKTLELHLGLKATIENQSGALSEKYDHEIGSYVRQLYFSITDDTNKELTGLSDVKLAYSDGTLQGLHEVDGKWDNGYYKSEITLTKPGKYSFRYITIGSSRLTRATSAPVYTLYSPEPPIYDNTSADSFAVKDGIQFVPNKLDAYLGVIRIKNSAGANLSAVLYNSETKEYYVVEEIQNATNGGKVNNKGQDEWDINLPYYTVGTGDNATKEIDGTWSLVCIKLWSCFVNDTAYTAENPLIWLGTSEAAVEYGEQNNLAAAENIDFSKLDTTVSNHVNVTMSSAKETLGDENTVFMTKHQVSELGISVRLTDAAGRTIPASKGDTMTLALKYDPTTAADCGYTVSSGYQSSWNGIVDLQQNSDGSWTPTADSAARTLQYVGKYAVTLTINKVAYTSEKTSSIPAAYTVISAGPTMDNLDTAKITVSQPQSIFGMDGTKVSGAFLASYQPSVTVNLPLKDAEGKEVQYVAISDAEVTLNLKHNGDSAEYGGYTWSGDNSKLTDYTLALRLSGTGYTTLDESGKQVALQLLAGTYSFTGTVTWKGQTADISNKLTDLTVYSAQPDVSITGMNPVKGTPVVANAYTGADNHLASNASSFTGITAGGDHYAVVYMAYEPYTTENNAATTTAEDGNVYTHYEHSAEYAHYTAPAIDLTAADYGAPFSFVLGKDTAAATTVTFSGNDRQTITIGRVSDKSHTFNEYCTGNSWGDVYGKFTYKAEEATIIGTNIIREVTSTVGDVTYTRTLRQPLYISQLAHGEPTLTVVRGVGVESIKVEDLDAGTELAGGIVAGATRLRVTVTAADGYFAPEVTASGGAAIDWELKKETHAGADDPNSMVIQRIYECRMPFDSMTLTASATGYPTLTYANAGKVSVAAAANGSAISSGSQVAPGTQVTVTVSTLAADGVYSPALSGLGTPVRKTDYSAAYTFTMGQQDTVLERPTAAAMVKLIPENGSGFQFAFKDTSENRSFVTEGYVIPGHTVTVTMTAQGSKDPRLTAPKTGVTKVTESTAMSTYTYVVPKSGTTAVTFTGTSVDYDKVVIDTTKACVTAFSVDNVPYTVVDSGKQFTQSVAPGTTVRLTLTAREGYYQPVVSQSGWTKESGDNARVTYQFTMPANGGVNAAADAKTAPTVTLNGSTTDITIAGANYDGSALSGMKVQPGTVVTVTVKAKAGYFNPAVSLGGAVESALSGRTAKGNGYDEAVYTFTMGTADVTLTGSAAQDPTVKVNGNSVLTASIKVGNAAVTRAHPGREVTVTVTAVDTHYNPRLTIGNGGIAFTKEWEGTRYVTYSYTFTMGAENVVLNGSATANPTVTVNCTDTSASFTNGNNARPGSTVTVDITPDQNYYLARATVTKGTHNGITATEDDRDQSSKYVITMGTEDITMTASATQKPYIIFSSINNCWVAKNNNSGERLTAGSTKWYVMPGDTVLLYVQNNNPSNLSFDRHKKYPTINCPKGVSTVNIEDKEQISSVRKYKHSTYTLKVAESTTTGALSFTAVANQR